MKPNNAFVKSCLVVVLCTTFSASAVLGQNMFSTNPFNNPLNNMMTTMINGRVNEEMLRQSVANQQGGGNGSSSNSTQPPVQARKSPAEINRIAGFRPTPSPLKVRELANMLGTTPEDREQAFTVFSNLLTYYAGEAKRLGKPNDFALALSCFLAINSSLYHGTPLPDDAHLLRLRNIIAEAMADDPQFARVTDRAKQELTETMVIFTLFTEKAIDESKQAGNQELVAGYRKFAGINLQNFCKVSPDTLHF